MVFPNKDKMTNTGQVKKGQSVGCLFLCVVLLKSDKSVYIIILFIRVGGEIST